MDKLVRWLADIERRAQRLYEQGTRQLQDDAAMLALLRRLAEEEGDHHALLLAAVDQVDPATMVPAIEADAATRRKIEGVFAAAEKRLRAGRMTPARMATTVAELEFSEWNDLFVYAMRLLRQEGREFQRAAAHLEHHRQDVITTLQGFPQVRQLLEKLTAARSIWRQTLLVVDDDRAVTRLLATIFSRDARVVLAEDGSTGLAELTSQHFDAVIADVNMPEKTGIEMYEEALKSDPTLGKRIVFYTAARRPELLEYFHRHGLRHLHKPVPLQELRETVAALLRSR